MSTKERKEKLPILKEKFGDIFDVKSGETTQQYRQFRGGGNTFILCQTLGAVILTEDLTYVSSQLEHGEAFW